MESMVGGSSFIPNLEGIQGGPSKTIPAKNGKEPNGPILADEANRGLLCSIKRSSSL